MKRWLERALNVRPGDLGRGVLLCSCLFLIITAYVIGKVARDALFLARFQAVQLPYADIASALLVGFVIAGYVRIARKASLINLIVGSQLFFATNCVLFWMLGHYYHPAWLFPVFYVWVGIFGVLAPTQIWTMANYVLTTREAKRIFGLVGGGAIAGWIAAGFISKTVVKALGTDSLVLAMSFLLCASAAVSLLFWKQQRSHAESADSHIGAAGAGPKDLFHSMRLIYSSVYLRAIAAVICISSFVTTLTGWQFKAIAKQFLVSKDALALLFANFNLYAGVLSLLFQVLFTTRLLRRFGIGSMLFVLPVSVLLGSTAVLMSGTLAAVLVLKGFDQVLRYSLDKSTAELLYLPVAARLKMQVKWFIDTVIWRMGDGLAGITVLIFATTLHVSARQLSWVAISLVTCWIAAVVVARRQYVAVLNDSLVQHRIDVEQATTMVLDRSTSELLAAKMTAADPEEILYALSLFETEREKAIHPVVRGLLSHPASEVRRKALSILEQAADKAVLPDVERLLSDSDLNVRTEAMLYLAHHAHVDPLTKIQEIGDFADFSLRSAMVAYLAHPGVSQNLEAARHMLAQMAAETGSDGSRCRSETARLLGELPDNFDPLLANLLRDEDKSVVRLAIRSVGKLRKRRLVPELLDCLVDPELTGEAAQSLSAYDNAIIGALRDHLADSAIPIQARREVPSILVRIGTAAAAQVLIENLLQSDNELRFRIISALNKLRRQHPELECDLAMLETVLAAEILGHYRSYQILNMLTTPVAAEDPVSSALSDSMKNELERIFRLLGLLYPNLDVHAAYVALQSKSISVHDNALEFLDSVLKPQLRELLVPLLDGKVSVAERANLANRLVHSKIESPEQAVSALVGSDDPWLRSCGAYAIGSLGLTSMESELNRCLEHPDALLRETARAAKLRLHAAGAS